NGLNYIVTANEGDSRDYDGYSEEDRVKDLTLNTAAGYYPDATTLQEDENLGRLKTTYADGDYNNDGTYEQIYSYGARSFSIFDQYGNIVFDSADQFGQTIAVEEPTLFNQDEEEFDGRSDDKGGEPEAIALGTIDGKTYAFIGLERQSSILMYDITNPKDVEFITYYKHNSTIGDVAPEIIKFIPASQSPNSKNLLLVGYEVSGSLAIIQVDDTVLSVSEVVTKNDFKMYPNPIIDTTLKFNKTLSGAVYNLNGQEVKTFNNKTAIDVSQLTAGVYILKTKTHGVKRFLKL
ncbi:T9SS type A sorting domain-containing protein, partial [Seonamhaeicola sp.]|uniref:choice-of-anchor I domain-containing protein n=1 Tax=Seonamhaeicola sp. TaxID=1912245 RepID=UPI0035662D61